ncbi:MAG TPA: hypothetical protein VG797_04565 [Phycisphaerales bacterium]|nr:hypothetical protein [Phycisphaerales bacterium]
MNRASESSGDRGSNSDHIADRSRLTKGITAALLLGPLASCASNQHPVGTFTSSYTGNVNSWPDLGKKVPEKQTTAAALNADGIADFCVVNGSVLSVRFGYNGDASAGKSWDVPLKVGGQAATGLFLLADHICDEKFHRIVSAVRVGTGSGARFYAQIYGFNDAGAFVTIKSVELPGEPQAVVTVPNDWMDHTMWTGQMDVVMVCQRDDPQPAAIVVLGGATPSTFDQRGATTPILKPADNPTSINPIDIDDDKDLDLVVDGLHRLLGGTTRKIHASAQTTACNPPTFVVSTPIEEMP